MNNSITGGMTPPNPDTPQTFQARRSSEFAKREIDVGGSLRRHWFIVLLVLFTVSSGGAYLLYKKAKPVFKSTSVVYISPKFPKMLSGDTEVELPYDSYVEDQIQTVTRYDIIKDAIERIPPWVRERSGPALPYEIQVLQRDLEVKRNGNSYEVSIALQGWSPQGLADTVNAVTDTYVERAKNEEFYGLDQRLSTLRDEEQRLQLQIDASLKEQAQLMQELGVATLSSAAGASDPYDSTLQTLRSQLAAATLQRQAAEANLDSMAKGNTSGAPNALDAAADEAVAADSGLSAVRSSLNTRRAALVEEMSGQLPANPIYKKDSEELASIDGMMNDLRRQAAQHLQDTLRKEVTRTRKVELELAQDLSEKTHSATSAAPKFQRAAELDPQIESLQKAYDEVEDRIRDLELESSSPGSIHVSTRALTPLGPEPSKLRLYLIVLVVGSIAFAIGIPVVVDMMDSRIYTPSDVERVVGFHPLGILLDDDEFRQEIAGEYYFRLAAGIDHAVRSSGARVFLFTAPTHDSGTSTVVRALSDRLRSFNLRTQTITMPGSGNLASSPIGAQLRVTLHLERPKHTSELSRTELVPLAMRTDNAGRRAADPTVGPTKVGTLHNAEEKYDVILIDAGPLPISANTEYLSRVSDATVLVVKSSVTTRAELERSARLLERLEVNGVAVVLNKVTRNRVDRALRNELNKYELEFGKRRSRKNDGADRERASA